MGSRFLGSFYPGRCPFLNPSPRVYGITCPFSTQWTQFSAAVSSAAGHHGRGVKGHKEDNSISPTLPWCKSWILKKIHARFFPQTESRFQNWRIKFNLGIFPSKWTTPARLKLKGLHKAAFYQHTSGHHTTTLQIKGLQKPPLHKPLSGSSRHTKLQVTERRKWRGREEN